MKHSFTAALSSSRAQTAAADSMPASSSSPSPPLPPLQVSSFNSSYKPGLVDGPPSVSRFRGPTTLCELPRHARPMALKKEGDIAPNPADTSVVVVADTGNNALRLVALGRQGGPLVEGICTKSFAASASWLHPKGICPLPSGLLVCDSGHHRIRSVSYDGERVVAFAGSGKRGHRDGPVQVAQFDTPCSICVCPSDKSIIVADSGNNAVRRIANGMVTTLAGGSGPDRAGGFVDGESEGAKFRRPTFVMFDKEETLLVIDSGNHCLRVMSPDWKEVRTLAGGPKAGGTDGAVDTCELNHPEASCLLEDGSILIADRENNKIRRLDGDLRSLSSWAGNGCWGATDGLIEESTFNKPCGVCCLEDGTIVISDSGNNCIRLVQRLRDKVEGAGQSCSDTRELSLRDLGEQESVTADKLERWQPANAGAAAGVTVDSSQETEMVKASALHEKDFDSSSDDSDDEEEEGSRTAWRLSRHVKRADASRKVNGKSEIEKSYPLDSSSSSSDSSGMGDSALSVNTRTLPADRLDHLSSFLSQSRDASSPPARRERESKELPEGVSQHAQVDEAIEGVALKMKQKFGSLKQAFAIFGRDAKDGRGTSFISSSSSARQRDDPVIDFQAWMKGLTSLRMRQLSHEMIVRTFKRIDEEGHGRIQSHQVEEHLRSIAKLRMLQSRGGGELKERGERAREETVAEERLREVESSLSQRAQDVEVAIELGQVRMAKEMVEEMRDKVKGEGLWDACSSQAQQDLLRAEERVAAHSDHTGGSMLNGSSMDGPHASSPLVLQHFKRRGLNLLLALKAQLFYSKGEDEEMEYRAPVLVCMLQSSSRKEDARIAFVRQGSMKGELEVMEERGITHDLKVESSSSPFWLLLSWTEERSASRRRFGLRFAKSFQSALLQRSCRDALLPPWKLAKDSIFLQGQASKGPGMALQGNGEETKRGVGGAGAGAGAGGVMGKRAEKRVHPPPSSHLSHTRSSRDLLEALREHLEDFDAALRALDTDRDGLLSVSQLKDAVLVLNDMQGLQLTRQEVEVILCMTHVGKSGKFDFRDFLAGLRLSNESTVDSRAPPSSSSSAAAAAAAAADLSGSKLLSSSLERKTPTQTPTKSRRSEIDPLAMADRFLPKEFPTSSPSSRASPSSFQAARAAQLQTTGKDRERGHQVLESTIESSGEEDKEETMNERTGDDGWIEASFLSQSEAQGDEEEEVKACLQFLKTLEGKAGQQHSFSLSGQQLDACMRGLTAGLRAMERERKKTLVLTRYEQAVFDTVDKFTRSKNPGGGGGGGEEKEEEGKKADMELVIEVGGVEYALLRKRNAVRALAKPHDLLEDQRLSVLRDSFFSRGYGRREQQQADLRKRLSRLSNVLHQNLSQLSGRVAAAEGASRRREAKSVGGRSPAPSQQGSYRSSVERGAKSFEERIVMVEELLEMRRDSIRHIGNARDYYRVLAELLAPEALLVEWQVADALGVATFRDEKGTFYAPQGSCVWVRLSVWGFRFARISVNVAGRAIPAAGGVKYDEEKDASYVLFRHELPASSKSQDSPSNIREEVWTRRLRHEELSLSVTASVELDGSQARVALEGSMRVKMAAFPDSAPFLAYADRLREDLRTHAQHLPPSLVPVALHTQRSYARAAILDEPC